jgi:hypothetical protein
VPVKIATIEEILDDDRLVHVDQKVALMRPLWSKIFAQILWIVQDFQPQMAHLVLKSQFGIIMAAASVATIMNIYF